MKILLIISLILKIKIVLITYKYFQNSIYIRNIHISYMYHFRQRMAFTFYSKSKIFIIKTSPMLQCKFFYY